jgi:hypothetical protein
MLLDTGKLGSLRDIEMTDFRSVLHFMQEYPDLKNEQRNPKEYVPGDQTDFA